jgi:hypothetical protein
MFYFLDNSLDQKKLNEYNIPGFIEKPQGTPVKTKEKSIEEEIKFLTQLSLRVQEKNENYKKLIEEKIKTKSGYQTIDEEFDYEFEKEKTDDKKSKKDTNSKKNKKLEKVDLILKNSAYHIYKMQLTQFAESIKRIYKNTKTNEYMISFDNTDEDIPPIILDEKDYQNLIAIRDKYPNNDILSGFISNENCVNPNSLNGPKKNKSLTPIKNNNHSFFSLPKKEKPKYKDDIYINSEQSTNIFHPSKGNLYYLSSYNICHQCKLQKMDEDLIKCQCVRHIPISEGTPPSSGNHSKKNNKKNNNNPNLENPINYFFIGQSAIILLNKIYYLRNYDDSVKELVDTYFLNKFKENDKKCEKYYCKNCLRTTYDFDVNEIKKKNFKCPSCSNRCNCSRCIRNENLIKQIAYYLNNYGDINKLYDYLVKQNSIFDKLKDYLLLSKFICVDFNTKNSMPIKINYGNKNSNSSNNITNDDEKNNEINFDELMKYKKNLEKKQMEFCDIFDETNLKKKLFETQLIKLNENGENKEIKDNKDKKENKDKKDKIEKKEKNEEKKVKKFIGKKMKRTSKKKK